MRGGERGWPFVPGMIAALCAVCGLAALFGVPASGGLFFGLAGMLLGIGAARVLLPRRNWGLTGRTILMFVAVGGVFVGSYFSVLDFSTVRGAFFLGAYLGFWPVAVSGLTDLTAPQRTRGWRRVSGRRAFRQARGTPV